MKSISKKRKKKVGWNRAALLGTPFKGKQHIVLPQLKCKYFKRSWLKP